MAYTTINKHTDYFNTKLYTGNGTNPTSITGVGFQPDWLWIKRRDATGGHNLYDVVRGNTKRLESHGDGAEATTSDISSFDSDGFTVNTTGVNTSSATYVAWNWKAGNSSGSTNNDGSVTSTVSANTTAGFSIVKWTGNGTNDATIGHGLGVAPKLIIVKNTTDAVNWRVWHTSLSANNITFLNTNQAEMTPAAQGNGYIKTVGTSTFSTYAGGTDDNGVNGNGDAMIAYCFAEKSGYSKFGSYTGNGNADGPFIYTGFKPAWLMVKRTNTTENWYMKDNKRDPYNEMNQSALYANGSAAEDTGGAWLRGDALSNGFKIRINDTSSNGSGSTYIYMAFGQSLVGSNNIPCTAR
jgi:hypothetical protein